MTINDNSTKSINAAIIDLQNQIKQLQHKIGILSKNQLKEDDIEFPGKVEYADEAGKAKEADHAGYADSAEYGTFGMLGGTKQASSENFDDLLNNELCSNTSGGLSGGSIYTTTTSLGIGAGWYNFLYIPHRTGISSDNTAYGTLFVTPMTANSNIFYIIHRISGYNYTAFTYAGS